MNNFEIVGQIVTPGSFKYSAEHCGKKECNRQPSSPYAQAAYPIQLSYYNPQTGVKLICDSGCSRVYRLSVFGWRLSFFVPGLSFIVHCSSFIVRRLSGLRYLNLIPLESESFMGMSLSYFFYRSWFIVYRLSFSLSAEALAKVERLAFFVWRLVSISVLQTKQCIERDTFYVVFISKILFRNTK